MTIAKREERIIVGSSPRRLNSAKRGTRGKERKKGEDKSAFTSGEKQEHSCPCSKKYKLRRFE